MKAKVIAVHSGSQYTDGKERITLRFDDADMMYNTLQIINSQNLSLDQGVVAEIKVTEIA